MQIDPIYDPAQLTHSRLLEFALMAAWISTVAAAHRDLEDLVIDVPPEERVLPDFSTPWPWDFDSFVVARSRDPRFGDESENALDPLLSTWLREDREHWPVFCLTLVDPWQERLGICSAQAPEWLRAIDTIATTARAKYDPCDRHPAV